MLKATAIMATITKYYLEAYYIAELRLARRYGSPVWNVYKTIHHIEKDAPIIFSWRLVYENYPNIPCLGRVHEMNLRKNYESIPYFRYREGDFDKCPEDHEECRRLLQLAPPTIQHSAEPQSDSLCE